MTGASVLKTALGGAAAAMGDQELQRAAAALGGVVGIANILRQVQSGAFSTLTGGLSGGAGVAAVLSAALGQIAQSTGDPTLAKAAQAAGIAGNAIGLGATAAAIPGMIAAPAAVGIGSAAGAAFAPAAAGILAWEIANMIEPGSAPNFMDMFTGGRVDPYLMFGKRLGQQLNKTDTNLATLNKALPYAQSKEELGQILNQFRQSVRGEQYSWYGDDTPSPYDIPSLPGAGGSKHEWGQVADYAPFQNFVQSQVNTLRNTLPGNEIGNLSTLPTDPTRLWGQFQDQSAGAPIFLPTGTRQGPAYSPDSPGLTPGFYSPEALPSYGGVPQDAIMYGQPGYDYAGAGRLAPGQVLGAPSAAYTQMWTPPAPQPVPQPAPQPAPTIPMTGGSRVGIGAEFNPTGVSDELSKLPQFNEPGAPAGPTARSMFAGNRSPVSGSGTGQVDPSIVRGLAQKQQPMASSGTGFVSGGKGV